MESRNDEGTPEPPVTQDAKKLETIGPVVSVIVPVRNSPKELRLCLERLFASQYGSYEVIVVDDASTDETSQVVADFPAILLRNVERLGPAGARNRAAGVARGQFLFFLDADVLVQPETLYKIATRLTTETDLDALFGSYDMEPAAGNVLSQYKNLFHHFVHQDSDSRASTFWSGCGAIKRDLFLKIGGFSVHYGRPSIEDIELGARLHKAGHRIMLDKSIQVTHLKRWTLWSMIKTDVLDRGVPWTELMLREGEIPNQLNVKYSQRISVALAYGLLVIFGIAVWYYRNILFAPVFIFVLVAFFDYWSTRRRFSSLIRVVSALLGLGTLALIGYVFKFWPLLPLALIVGIIAMNFRFYAFFLSQRHLLLLALLLPLHLIYFLYCGFSFGMGLTLYVWKRRVLPMFISRPAADKASEYIS